MSLSLTDSTWSFFVFGDEEVDERQEQGWHVQNFRTKITLAIHLLDEPSRVPDQRSRTARHRAEAAATEVNYEDPTLHATGYQEVPDGEFKGP